MRVEIWSDVVCPWCAIGKRRFEDALARFPHQAEVSVRWRSFELDPSAPRVRTGDYAGHLATKYGASLDDARAMIERMCVTATGEGLHFDFDRAQPGNTFDAHRLLHLAANCDRQHELKERLLVAYHSEGQAIGAPDVLQRLAVDAGLPAADVTGVLDSDRFADDVRADEREAHLLGITGVPFFVLDRRYGVSGAQPAEVLVEAFQRAWEARTPLQVSGGDGQDCGPAGCAT